ncbi:hypothetical protein GCM10023168_35780 [Fodinibacter luteus]|uniref:Uncharacterized protein n=2 Tax=Fodinibacter luteus TaxID=552064 RepID=A0ABP8KR37_9MICO
MGPDRRPVVVLLEHGFVLSGGGRGALPGDEDGLTHPGVDVLKERQQQRCPAGVADQHGVGIEGVVGQYLGQEVVSTGV